MHHARRARLLIALAAAPQFDKDNSEELDYEEFRMYTMACESIESRPAHSLALAKKG